MLSGLVSSGMTGPTRSRARRSALTISVPNATSNNASSAGNTRTALRLDGKIELTTNYSNGVILSNVTSGGTSQIQESSGSLRIFASAAGLSNAAAVQIHWLGAVGVPSGGFFGWLAGSDLTTQPDTRLYREAAYTIAQRNGVNPQLNQIYNTYTSATSFERCNISWIGNVLTFGTSKGGDGGTARALAIQTDGITQITVGTNGLVSYPTTVTAGGTTGAQTINKLTGTVNIAAAGTSVVVTNTLVSVNSIVMCVIRTNDTTARIANVVPAAGSFTINIVATTAEVSIGFLVVN